MRIADCGFIIRALRATFSKYDAKSNLKIRNPQSQIRNHQIASP